MISYGSVAGFIRRDMQQEAEPKKCVLKDGYKVCRKCGNVLPKTMFTARMRNSDGLDAYCKECAREYRKQYKEARKRGRL